MVVRLPGLSFSRSVPPLGDRLPGAETVTVTTADGVELRGWWVEPSGDPAGSVLVLHGIGWHRGGMVRRAELLVAHGWAVLLLDLRAHGESGGARTGFGGAEAADAAAGVAWIRER